MNHFHFLLLASMALGVAMPAAQATTQQIEYLGVDPGQDAKSVAIAIIGPSNNAKTYHKCSIGFVRNLALRQKKRIPDSHIALALAPGKHLVSAMFRDIDRESFIWKEFVFEAGQRYRVYCHGDNLRDAEIVVQKTEP